MSELYSDIVGAASQPLVASRRTFLAAGAAAAAAALLPASVRSESAAAKRFTLIGFTKPFQQLSFEETADVVAEVGWDGIECPVRPKGQIEPERAADELPRLLEALKARGKELTILTTAITSLKQPHAEQLLRTAAKLGIKRYRLGFTKYDFSRPIPDQVREVAAQLRDLAALNAELGLQAGFQNHSGRDYVGGPIWDIWTMIRDIDPQQIGVCFDIGHATIEGGMSWPVQARLMQPHLASIFVKDFVWQRGPQGARPQWVMLGEGLVNPSFFKWLQGTPFAGPISQHHEYEHGEGKEMIAKLRQDLETLRQWLAG